MASSTYLTYQPSLPVHSYQSIRATKRIVVSEQVTQTQYQLLATNCISEMHRILYAIEFEKQKVSADLQLIQSYIHLHWQRLHEFQQYIPFLPLSNLPVPYISITNQPKPQYASIDPTKHVNHDTNLDAASIQCTDSLTELQPMPSNESSSSNNSSDPLCISDINALSVSDPLSIQTQDTLQRVYSKPSLSTITPRTQSMSTSETLTPITPAPVTIRSLLPIYDDDIYINNEDIHKCESIEDCASVLNIRSALLFYQSYQQKEETQDENRTQLHEFLFHKYTNLINDYHHILQQHLNKDTISNNSAFEEIHDEMCQYIECDIHTCRQYQRNERDRETQWDHDVPYGIAPFIDILDTIHCYFLHSFDTGYRIDAKHQQQMQIDPEEHKEEDTDHPWNDLEMKQLKQYLHHKRKSLRNISGLSRRIKHYKFCTPNPDHGGLIRKNTPRKANDDESGCSLLSFGDTESIASLASLASIASTVHSYASSMSLSDAFRANMHLDMYSFGHRFYYWEYYKDKSEKDAWNHGYMFCDWYIDHKYSNLKDEILYNDTHRLNRSKYEAAKRKAQTLWRSHAIKAIKCDTHFFEESYGICKNDAMSMEHILSLIFYTDYDVLCYEFSKSFRKKYHSETYQSLKKRNSEFANYSKLLRESIECFGEKMKNTQIKVFYHGVSRHLLNALVCRFCGPCSTTPQLEVATLFSKQDGIILELEKYSDNLRYFNCALLSCYGNEDERLFIGGRHYLNICSVREIRNGFEVNYFYFIRALSVFNQAIEGKRHIRIETVRKKDYDIINKLIKHQLASMSVIDGMEDIDDANEMYSNRFPDYINSCFNRLVQSKKKIKINLYWLRRAYPGFQREFIDRNCPNLVRFDVLCAIFYCCTKVSVNMDQFDTDRNITVTYLVNLRRVLVRLNKIYHSRVRQISIKGTKQLFDKQEMIKQKFIFNGCGWKLEIQRNAKKDESNLLLTNLNMKRSSLSLSRSHNT